MSLAPLLEAPPIIQLHAYAAILAFVLGGLVLFRRKGDARHRLLGRVWVALMALTALSSFFIWTIRLLGPFSPIHILSVLTLISLVKAVGFARAGNILAHRATMQSLYLMALVITGLFTFLPGRIMHEVVFGADGANGAELLVFAGVALAAANAGFLLVRKPLGWRVRAHSRRATRSGNRQ